jgi:hypothetical protein
LSPRSPCVISPDRKRNVLISLSKGRRGMA